MTRATVVLIVSATLIGSRDADAQGCVNDHHRYTTHAARISINTDSSLQSAAIDAAALWSQCGGIASFVANDGGDAVPISVNFNFGESPRADGACANGTEIASWNVVVGGTIEIWEGGGKAPREDLRGQPCTTNWAALIAHEVGHVLGLHNSTCAGYLMGPDWGTCLGPAVEECGNVNQKWVTPEEQREMCNVSCTSGECVQGTAGWYCPDTSGDPGGSDSGGDGCTWGACSPLVLDLNGDGIHTTSAGTDPVLFDLNGDGVLDLAGWTHPATEEALLYYDHNQNRVVDRGAELFGEVTVLPEGRRAQNGFEALAAYDDPSHGGNGDGVISPADRVWGRIRLWVDRNHDGLLTNDENYSLSQADVVQLELTYEQATANEAYGLDAAGNYHFYRGAFVHRDKQRDTVRALHDVYFAVNPWSGAGTHVPDR